MGQRVCRYAPAWFAARAAQGSLDRQASSSAVAAAASEGAELLEKAKGLRMNTEARRAIFCVIMGAEDFADALERLLRLPLVWLCTLNPVYP
jgi:nucleolar MIF4G domain-containing protein 1